MKRWRNGAWMSVAWCFFVVEAFAQTDFLGSDHHRAKGSWASGTQTLVGVPWYGLEAGLWRTIPGKTSKEWSAALGVEGWGALQEAKLRVGFWHGVRPGWALEAQFGVGMSTWTDLPRRSGHGIAFARLTRTLPSGLFRWEIHSSIGHGRTALHLVTDPDVALGTNTWGWQGWWVPHIEGATVPLPAMGWSQGGIWHLAWGPNLQAWREARLWLEAVSRFQLQVRFPATQWEVSWTKSLGRSSTDSGEITASGGRKRGLNSVQPSAGRVTLTRREASSGAGWRWTWNSKTGVE
ncbi:MAG: hypothetical protein ACPG66_00280 [Flavobacteriales bacterium]